MTNSKWFGNSDADVIGDLQRRISTVESYATDLERKIANFDSPQPISRVDPVTYLNPFEGQRAIDPADEQHMWYSNGEWRKAGGFGIYEIKVFDDTFVVTTGDDKFIWPIPHELDDGQIIEVEAAVTTAGSGTTTIAIRKGTAGTAGSDILSTNITIDSGEYNSKDAATQPVVIDPTIATWGQHLHIDVDAVGSGAKGLCVMVTLVPSNLASIVLAGAQGPAGGITDWTGQWVTATGYTVNEAVSNNGSSYVAIVDHTSGATSEPGVGANWEDFWMLLAEGSSGGSGMSTPVTQTAHGLAVGDIVRFDGTNYVKAQADTEAHAEVVGLVSVVGGANDFTLVMGGDITGLTGLTSGSVYYLSPTTAGALTTTEPTTIGQVSKPLLVAHSTTTGFLFNMRGVVVPTPIEVGQSQADGWTRSYAETWTYASATTFTVAGDQTVKFSKGTRIKLTQSTVKYFIVSASSFSAGVTTVTITGGTDYTLANATVSDNYYSYEANPQGYPGTFNYTLAWTSTGTAPSFGNAAVVSRFSMVGNICRTEFFITFGSTTTFGTGSYRFSAPITIAKYAAGSAWAVDQGTSFRSGLVFVDTGNNVIRILSVADAADEWAATVPNTWANTDLIVVTATFEI